MKKSSAIKSPPMKNLPIRMNLFIFYFFELAAADYETSTWMRKLRFIGSVTLKLNR